jgi:hypothetical protein
LAFDWNWRHGHSNKDQPAIISLRTLDNSGFFDWYTSYGKQWLLRLVHKLLNLALNFKITFDERMNFIFLLLLVACICSPQFSPEILILYNLLLWSAFGKIDWYGNLHACCLHGILVISGQTLPWLII